MQLFVGGLVIGLAPSSSNHHPPLPPLARVGIVTLFPGLPLAVVLIYGAGLAGNFSWCESLHVQKTLLCPSPPQPLVLSLYPVSSTMPLEPLGEGWDTAAPVLAEHPRY